MNVPTTDPTHTNETPLPVVATEPDQPQARYTAAQRRVDLANIAVDAALTHSIAAHVTLRFAQANANYANAGNHNQAHDALENARRAVSRADDAWLECQLELLQAHVARSHAESDARHAGSPHPSANVAALQLRTSSQELQSVVPQQTSQNDGDQEKERWKGKGRAEKPDSSSAAGKRTLDPFRIVKRVFRRGLPNDQHSPQKSERSRSEPTLQSPIPPHNASSSRPANQGLVIANGSGTDKDGTGSGNAGSSESKKKDGAEDGNPDGTQVSEDTRKAEETGDSTSPGNSQTPGNSTSPDNSTSPTNIPPGGNGIIPPGGDGNIPPDETGKKPGILRKMSSDLLSKLKTKK